MNYSIFILFTAVVNFLFSSQTYDQNTRNHKKLLIDVHAKDELSISKIGELVKIVPLQQTTSDLFLSRNRIIVDEAEDCLFITYGNFPLSVYQYKLSTGEQVRIIKKDNITLFDYPIQNFVYPDEKSLGIVCKDQIFKYDFKGNFLQKFKIQGVQGIGDVYFFNDHYWGFNLEFTDKGFDRYTLFSTENFEMNDTKFEFIHKRGDCEPDFIKVGRFPFFNTVGGSLYFSNQADPVLYRLNKNGIETVCEYGFNTSDFTCPDFFSRQVTLLGDHWLIIQYNYKNHVNSCFYSLKTNELYNLTDGIIMDDVFGTERILPKIRIANENYFCFILPTDKIKSGLVIEPGNSKLCIVLMKVK